MTDGRVLLVRPGTYRGIGTFLPGRGKTPLSVVGRAQAHALSASLNAAKIGRIFHSPSFRAEMTARIIGYVHDQSAAAQADAALDDIDYGTWAGQTLSDLENDPLWVDWHRNPEGSPPPGGEAIDAAGRRLLSAASAMIDDGEDPAVAVTHRNLILAALATVLDCGFAAAQRFTLLPASITMLRRTGGEWFVDGINLRSGLGLVAPTDRGSWPEDREGVGELWASDGVCRLGI